MKKTFNKLFSVVVIEVINLTFRMYVIKIKMEVTYTQNTMHDIELKAGKNQYIFNINY